jgi:hypothetical protein
MTRLIVGRFDDIENARGALSALAAEEVESHEYGLFFVTQHGMHDIYPIGGDAHSDQGARQGGGGAMKGAGLGGATGLAIGAFAAVVPVVGIAALVAATGVGAYIGSLYGALAKTQHANESEATQQHPVEQPGGPRIAVSVERPDTEPRAVEVLRRFGADDLGQAEGEWRGGDWADFDPRVPPKPLDPPASESH